MKYNILIITSSYPAISGESFEGACVETLAQELALCGNNVAVLTHCVRKAYYKDSIYLSVQRFQWSKVVKPLSTLRIVGDSGKICLYFFNGFAEVQKVVKQNRIDFVICAWAIPSGIFGLYLKKRFDIPYVIWALGSDIWNYSNGFVAKRILKLILNNALSLYADGISLLGDIIRLTRKRVDFLSSSRVLPQVKSKKLALNPRRTHFLYVGRYHTNKGPDILIESIQMLDSNIKRNSYFHFFGLGDMKQDLESLIEKYDLSHCVGLNGPINNYMLSEYLELVSFIVIPSRIESIPVILSDALQKRCSIIATNVGDLGALMAENHIGYVAQQADPSSLAKVLSEAMLENKDFTDGMDELYQSFDPRLNAKRIIEAFESGHR